MKYKSLIAFVLILITIAFTAIQINRDNKGGERIVKVETKVETIEGNIREINTKLNEMDDIKEGIEDIKILLRK